MTVSEQFDSMVLSSVVCACSDHHINAKGFAMPCPVCTLPCSEQAGKQHEQNRYLYDSPPLAITMVRSAEQLTESGL